MAYIILLTMMLDAPFFSFLDMTISLSFLVALVFAIIAGVFASRWWFMLVTLWLVPAVFYTKLLLMHSH